MVGNQRVTGFVDFVNGATQPYDDNGHGTHVSGIIAGLGVDSGYTIGMAPTSHIVSLKVLDAQGRGVISDVIAAMEYAIANRAAHNIRVINLSVGAAVTTSYNTDPLTLAAKRAVDAGIVVVTASGNFGRTADGQDAVRRGHRARQCALGADGRRVGPQRHAEPHRRHRRHLQLEGPDGDRPRGQARHRRARHRHHLVERAEQHALHHKSGSLGKGSLDPSPSRTCRSPAPAWRRRSSAARWR